MTSKTLKKIVEEDLHGADVSTKIHRISSGRIDDALSQRPLKLPIREIWKKTFARTKEEIERHNSQQRRFATRGNSYHYEYGGDNVVEVAIVPYEGNIPNAYIKIPGEVFSRYSGSDAQEQIVLGEEGILFREVRDSGPNGGIRAENKTLLGEMTGDGRHLIAKPYEAILRNTVRAFLNEPNDFLHDQYSPEHEDNDNVFSIVALVPKSHLSLENWWKENHRDFERSCLPKMSDWADVPLIHATILKPELERQGYILKKRE